MAKLQQGKSIEFGEHDLTIGGGRRLRSDALANRELILETAKRLFLEEGIEAVSMSQIARAAGVGKGTLYRAVANKGELCIALLDEDLRSFQNEAISMLNDARERTPLEQLDRFLDMTVFFFDNHSRLICAAQEHGLVLAGRPEREQRGVHGWFHQTVRQLLNRAQRAGLISQQSDVALLADLILAPLNPQMFAYQRAVGGYTLEQISESIRSFIFHGILLR